MILIYILDDLEWRELNNFKNIKNGIYEVSNYGDVRLKESGYILHKKIANKKKHPYHAVYIKNNNNIGEWVLVHQLVAHIYCNINDRYKDTKLELVPDHLDNNGLNNYYMNLEWKTRGENTKAAFEKGHCDLSCENHKDAFITNDEAHRICVVMTQYNCIDHILNALNYPSNKRYRTLITRMHRKSSFFKITSQYEFKPKLYTLQQLYHLKYLKDIIEYIDSGFSNKDIYDIIWGKPMKKKNEPVVICHLLKVLGINQYLLKKLMKLYVQRLGKGYLIVDRTE